MSAFSKICEAVSAIAPSVRVSEERGCIVLRGELSDWNDIVACGKAAVSKKYLGVINDIKLKGFQPRVRMPKISDNLYEGARPDVLIIGGGISGATIARELARFDLDIMLVEKGADVAVGATSRNDGCVHVGIDLTPGLKKHSYLVRGNAMYAQLCEDLGVKFDGTGHMMISFYKWEKRLYPIVKLWSKILKIPNMKYLDRNELLQVEPNVADWARGAFYMPSGGMVSPYKLTVALAENAAENGVKICLNTAVTNMEVKDGKILSVATNRGNIFPRLVINAAGVYADEIAEMAGDRTFTIHPRKGINLIMDKKIAPLVRTSVSKLPFVTVPDDWRERRERGEKEPSFLKCISGKQINETKTTNTKGGGVVHTVDNNVLVGPNAIEIPDKEEYTTDMDSVKAIFEKQTTIQDKMKLGDTITYFAGTRAATYEEDFVIRRGIFTKNIIEVAGIQSPGLTTAPAVAQDVTKWAVDYLKGEMKVAENGGFNRRRRPTPHLADMSEAERDALIRKNPLYGEIICRCEEISKGEILDAIHSPVPVYTVDGVKRRVRPGMGRCQGGFCSPQVIKILAEEKGCSVEEITKSNDYSTILMDKTKKGARTNV